MPYEAAATLIRDACTAYRKRSGTRPSQNELAIGIGIHPSTLSAYLTGRLQPGEHRKLLADFFFPKSLYGKEAPQRRRRFLAALDAARIQKHSDRPDRRYRAVLAGLEPARLVEYEYGVFHQLLTNTPIDAVPGLLDFIFERYCRLSFARVKRPVSVEPSEDFDFLLGILATPPRALDVRPYLLPVRIKVNAVFLPKLDPTLRGRNNDRDWWDDVGRKRAAIAAALGIGTPREFASPDPGRVAPITYPTEIGDTFVRNTLGMTPDESMIPQDPSPASFAECLKSAKIEHKTPVVVCDEFTCIRMLAKFPKGAPMLVFPVGAAESVFDDEYDQPPLPAYPLAIGVSRRQEQLATHFFETFELYLTADQEAIARHYRGVYERLRDEVETCLTHEVRHRDAAVRAEAWSKATLGLGPDVQHAIGPVWKAILTRVNQYFGTKGGEAKSRQPAVLS